MFNNMQNWKRDNIRIQPFLLQMVVKKKTHFIDYK